MEVDGEGYAGCSGPFLGLYLEEAGRDVATRNQAGIARGEDLQLGVCTRPKEDRNLTECGSIHDLVRSLDGQKLMKKPYLTGPVETLIGLLPV